MCSLHLVFSEKYSTKFNTFFYVQAQLHTIAQGHKIFFVLVQIIKLHFSICRYTLLMLHRTDNASGRQYLENRFYINACDASELEASKMASLA